MDFLELGMANNVRDSGILRVTDRLTTRDYWESTYSHAIRLRLPSRLISSTRDFQRLMWAHVKPNSRVLEIGCAPGKHLIWLGKVLGARVSGLDYSRPGVRSARALAEQLDVPADIRCEDISECSFPPHSFDVVYSMGVVEHFDDPSPVVLAHLDLLRPDGTAVITIPNYSGIYGVLQRRFDPENLEVHNLRLMNPQALRKLVPDGGSFETEVRPFGRVSPWLISWDKLWPKQLARLWKYAVNAAAIVQPLDVAILCPWLVLIVRGSSPR